MNKKLTIEDVPCHQCICLAMCKNKALYMLEEECVHVEKYFGKSSISSTIGFRKWSLLIKALYKDGRDS